MKRKTYLHMPGAAPLEFPWGQRVEEHDGPDPVPFTPDQPLTPELESYLLQTGFIQIAPEMDAVKGKKKEVVTNAEPGAH